ncbi:MAG: DEAD/DEAH box helicase [Nannocystaceae bacterium]
MSSEAPFLLVHNTLRPALERRGFSSLTAVQLAVLTSAADSGNLRISSETGSGKTVAIGLLLGPHLVTGLAARAAPPQGPQALVITPTRELAAQVGDELAWLYADVKGLDVAVVTGGTDIGRDRRTLSRRPMVVVGTPGRMLDHIRSGTLDCSKVTDVVLDEADQMLDMGFRDELDGIVEAQPETRRSHLVSATFPHAVRHFADRFQGTATRVEGTRLGEANQDIEHVAHLVRGNQRYDSLVNCLLSSLEERCLVFVQRRDDAAMIAERLAADGFSALPLSGDLPQAQRTRTLAAFRSGVVRTIVATDVAARGIDVADIANVVHLDLPMDSEGYTHRSGRTGRAGRKGRSVALVPPNAQARFRYLLRTAKVEASWLPVPTPAKIKRSLAKTSRRQLHDAIANGPALTEAEQAYAAKLLTDYDPAVLIARLLDLAQPSIPRQPTEIATLQVDPRETRPRQGTQARSHQGHDRHGTRSSGKPRPGRPRPTRGAAA